MIAIERDPELLARYERIERGEPGVASGVVRPVDEAEVGAWLAHCQREAIETVISAGRTGLVEAQRPERQVVLSLERLNRPLRLDWACGRTYAFDGSAPASDWPGQALRAWEALGRPSCQGLTLTVQAGLAVDALNQILEPLGRMWPMEMGSSSAASVGACAANASAGANALCYGTGAHMAESAWGFWADGSAAGPCRAEPWAAPVADRLAVDSATIRPEWGLLGSQGLFGVITRLCLRTYPIPAHREAALVPVPDMPSATRLLDRARAEFGADVEEFEFMSMASIDWVRQLRGEGFRLPFEPEASARYLILIQLKSDQEHPPLAERLYAFLAGPGGFADDQIGYAPLSALKAIRHSITEASNLRVRNRGGGRLAFDTATPIQAFGGYLDQLARVLRDSAPEVEFVAFGHAGVGGAHLHLIGERDSPVSRHADTLIRIVFDVTQAHGGTFSAEHGIGTKWGGEFVRRTSVQALAQLLALKHRHDPAHILSPSSFGLDKLR